jgi:hypothetical protein
MGCVGSLHIAHRLFLSRILLLDAALALAQADELSAFLTDPANVNITVSLCPEFPSPMHRNLCALHGPAWPSVTLPAHCPPALRISSEMLPLSHDLSAQLPPVKCALVDLERPEMRVPALGRCYIEPTYPWVWCIRTLQLTSSLHCCSACNDERAVWVGRRGREDLSELDSTRCDCELHGSLHCVYAGGVCV